MNFIISAKSVLKSAPLKICFIAKIDRDINASPHNRSVALSDNFSEILIAELKITDIRKQEQITKALDTTPIDKFDKDMIRKFVKTNLSFYS